MKWTVLDCRPEGIERLSVVDRETETVICRIENSVSGRPIGDDDLANAAMIACVPILHAEIERLEGLFMIAATRIAELESATREALSIAASECSMQSDYIRVEEILHAVLNPK